MFFKIGYKNGYKKGSYYDHYSYYANQRHLVPVAITQIGLEQQIRYYLNHYNKRYGKILNIK